MNKADKQDLLRDLTGYADEVMEILAMARDIQQDVQGYKHAKIMRLFRLIDGMGTDLDLVCDKLVELHNRIGQDVELRQ